MRTCEYEQGDVFENKPENFYDQDILVLAASSDDFGMHFPSSPNISDEVEEGVEPITVDQSVKRLDMDGYLENRRVSGSAAPYKPSDEGEDVLEQVEPDPVETLENDEYAP